MPGNGTGHSGGGHSGGGHSGGGFSGGTGHSGGGFSGGGFSGGSGHSSSGYSGYGFSGNNPNDNNGYYRNTGMYGSDSNRGHRPPSYGKPSGCLIGVGIIITLSIIVFAGMIIFEDNVYSIFNDDKNEWSWATETAIPEDENYYSVYIPGSTWKRTPFKGESEFIGRNFVNDSSIAVDVNELNDSVAYFSKLTGVQTVLYLDDSIYDAYEPWSEEIDDLALKNYAELFGEYDESHLLVTFFMYSDESYYCVPTYGFETETVLDEEAREILLYSIDYFFEQNYKSEGLSDCLIDAFNFSAERIMNGYSNDIYECFNYEGPYSEYFTADSSMQATEETGMTEETSAESTEEQTGETSAESTEEQTEETSATEPAEETEPVITSPATTIPMTEKDIPEPTQAPIDDGEDDGEDTGFVLSSKLIILIVAALGLVAVVVITLLTKKAEGDGDDGSYKRKDDGVERNHNPYGDYYDPERYNRK